MEIKGSNIEIIDAVSTGEIRYASMRKKKKKKSFLNTVYEWIDSFLISLIAIIILFTFFLGKVRVDGPSMENTLHSDDQLIITDFNYTASRGDIVIVSRNATNVVITGKNNNLQPIVKRVIAIEGDTIEIKNGNVYVNDVKQDEPYIKDYNTGKGTENNQFKGKQTVPEGRIFVMGDNRSDSHDSRSNDIYFIDKRYVLGHVLCRVFPFNSITKF